METDGESALVCGHLRKSPAIGCTNAHASKTTKRGAADFVVVLRGANLGQPPIQNLYFGVLVAAARCLTSATIAMNRGSLCSDVRSGSFSISSASDGFSPVSSACRKSDSAFGRFPLRAS